MATARILTVIARPLLSASFVSGGLAGLRGPGPLPEMARAAGIPAPEAAVQGASATMLVAGSTLALGIAPARSATVLAACLAGVTYGIHGFWRDEEPGPRLAHRNAFLANVGIAGGLALVVAQARAQR
jgi:putative oxidoreductase